MGRGLDFQAALNGLETKRRKQRSFYFTLELLLHLQHLIHFPSLPTINHVHKCSLLITVLLISPDVDKFILTTVDKHPGVTIPG